MKKWSMLLTFCMIVLFLKAQKGQTEVGLLLGNNGQLDKTLNDFYFWGSETYYLDDSNDGVGRNFKLGISGRYYFTDNISARVKFGYAMRNGKDSSIHWNQHIDYKLKHNVSNVSPAICFTKQIDKLEIGTGVEIPLMFVSPFKLVTRVTDFENDSVTVKDYGINTTTMSKGFVWGINNFIQVKYWITDYLAIGGEIDYGILFAHLGKTVDYRGEAIYPEASTYIASDNKKYKKTFFSTPEVSLGIFFRFGSKGSHCIVPGKKA